MSESAAGGGRRAIPRIHAVTDDLTVAHPGFATKARAVMHALGAHGAIHLRSRALGGRALFELASALRITSARTGCALLINDRVDVALATAVAGVQLTSRSLGVPDARRLIGEGLVGASVHRVAGAVAAARNGADWVVAGHIFRTASHPHEPGRGIELLTQMADAIEIPCVAIGGIRPEHVPALRAVGAYGVASISGIWQEDDAARSANVYLSAMTSTLEAQISLQVNGDLRRVAAGSSVHQLLASLGLDPRTVVVEHNRTILRDRDQLPHVRLAEGDVVEIVHFVGGG